MPTGVYVRTAESRRITSEAKKNPSVETRKKMSEAAKGKHFTAETRRKMSEAKKNPSVETRRKLSEAAKSKHFSAKSRRKIGEAQKGRVHSTETRRIMSEAHKGKHLTAEHRKKLSGINHNNWKGGISPLNLRIRTLFEYNQWRSNIFQRDNWTCQECGKKGDQQVHHKISFSKILHDFLKEYNQFSPIDDTETIVRLAIKWKPFWDTDNGITLCEGCHKLTDSYGGEKSIKETIV